MVGWRLGGSCEVPWGLGRGLGVGQGGIKAEASPVGAGLGWVGKDPLALAVGPGLGGITWGQGRLGGGEPHGDWARGRRV